MDHHHGEVRGEGGRLRLQVRLRLRQEGREAGFLGESRVESRESKDLDQGPPSNVRLDVWLDVACLFPTRSKAAAACAGGKVDLNGHAASAHKLVKPGDALAITTPSGKRTFRVVAVTEKHVPKAQARALYEETTPPPSPLEVEARRLERLLAPRPDSGGRPTKRDRRLREKLKGR